MPKKKNTVHRYKQVFAETPLLLLTQTLIREPMSKVSKITIRRLEFRTATFLDPCHFSCRNVRFWCSSQGETYLLACISHSCVLEKVLCTFQLLLSTLAKASPDDSTRYQCSTSLQPHLHPRPTLKRRATYYKQLNWIEHYRCTAHAWHHVN